MDTMPNASSTDLHDLVVRLLTSTEPDERALGRLLVDLIAGEVDE